MAVDDSYTKSLLHFQGADASTTFTDENPYHVWTPVNNAQIDDAQSVFGSRGMVLDGTGDFLTGDGHADFSFPGDFTVDFRFRLASQTNPMLMDFRPSYTTGAYITIPINSTYLVYEFQGATKIQGTAVMAKDTWYHLAVARSGTDTKMFLNGTQEGSTYSGDATTVLVGANRPVIGANGWDTSYGNVNGWFDEVRFSKGIARWTGNFTLPVSEYRPRMNYLHSRRDRMNPRGVSTQNILV